MPPTSEWKGSSAVTKSNDTMCLLREARHFRRIDEFDEALGIVMLPAPRGGNFTIIEGVPCRNRSIRKIVTGKHGGTKYWVDGTGVFDSVNRTRISYGGGEVPVPTVEKFTNIPCQLWMRESDLHDHDEVIAVPLPEEASPLHRRLPPVLRWTTRVAKLLASHPNPEWEKKQVAASSYAIKGVRLTIIVSCGHFQIVEVLPDNHEEFSIGDSPILSLLHSRWLRWTSSTPSAGLCT